VTKYELYTRILFSSLILIRTVFITAATDLLFVIYSYGFMAMFNQMQLIVSWEHA